MQQPTILQSVRIIDPRHDVDRVADVLIADGIVRSVAEPGTAEQWNEHPDNGGEQTRLISPPKDGNYLLTPGLVDCHTHVFGSAGVSRADILGVEAGVPIIVDAGGPGAATIDDFVSIRVEPSRTRVHALMSIESGGVTESHPGHNTTSATHKMVTSSIDTFLGAIDRHADVVVGLKVWSSAASGLRWIDHGVSLSEMTSLPMMVHIGDVTGADPDLSDSFTGDVLDRLQGGDVVTHSFTGLPGGLINAAGKIRSEVTVARDRGVLFDIAPGLVNLNFGRAVAAMEQGWIPDTISSDAHRWFVEQYRCPSLLRVMSSFLALGLALSKTIECASTNAAEAFGIQTGAPREGEVATLSLLSLQEAPTMFSDGETSIRGSESLAPVGCFIEGEWIEAREQARSPELLASEHRVPFFSAIAEELAHHRSHDERWRGIELHQLIHRARRDCNLTIGEAINSFYAEISPDETAIPAGWILEQLGPDETMKRFSPFQTT